MLTRAFFDGLDLSDGAEVRQGRLRFVPRFAAAGADPLPSRPWLPVGRVLIRAEGGEVLLDAAFEAPAAWSPNACQVVCSKYAHGAADSPDRESSAWDIFDRVVAWIASVAHDLGYFRQDADAVAFAGDLFALQWGQSFAFNSPVYFNVGHTLRGLEGGTDLWTLDPDGHAVRCMDSYANPQVHACFIQPVEDSIAGIMDLAASEARIFKYGSGSGTDLSTLRSSREAISGGGRPSGPVSFMRIYDAVGATIKSGGKCLPGYQKVWTTDGPMPVSQLSGRQFLCLSYDPPAGRYKIKRAFAAPSTVKRIVRVTTDKGQFDLSSDHNMRLAHGGAIQAGRLAVGMRLFAASVDQAQGYVRVHLRDGRKGKEKLHRLVASDIMGCDIRGKHVDHKDDDKRNNRPENLVPRDASDHARRHNGDRVSAGSHVFQVNRYPKVGADNPMSEGSAFWRDEGRSARYRDLQGAILAESGRARTMQAESGRRKMMNTAWRLMNAGHSIGTFGDYCVARELEMGRFQVAEVARAIEGRFGDYDGFMAEVDRNNHRVVSVEDIGEMQTYSVEVECPTADDKSPSSGHNFVIWDHATDTIEGRGVCVFNTRRSAKMQTLRCFHPDIIDFVRCKRLEEAKARALIARGYPADFNGEAYLTVAFQNSNLSVGMTDAFMEMADRDPEGTMPLLAVTTGEEVGRISPAELLDEIAAGSWDCGDPAVQFVDTINRWHTTPASGPINSSNPCSEFLNIDNSACNLASLNLRKFRQPDGSFDVERFGDAVRLAITAQDAMIDRASYPTAAIAEAVYRHRQLGLGYANLGGDLMACGIPYDSEEGRAWCGAVTSLMTATAYRAGAELAEALGPFPAWEANRGAMLGVLGMHRDRSIEATAAAMRRGYDESARVLEHANQLWGEAIERGRAHGFRNSQATLVAPTGTIAFMMDCDTLGIEPDIALLKAKKLAGGGTMTIVNQCVRPALVALGYEPPEVDRAVAWVDEYGTVEDVPGESRPSPIFREDWPVFACSLPPARGVLRASLPARSHLEMMAAAQPFLSGAISKTINMQEDSTVEDIRGVFMDAWKAGLKSVTVYRDNSKGSQPVSASAGTSGVMALVDAAVEASAEGDHDAAEDLIGVAKAMVSSPDYGPVVPPSGVADAPMNGVSPDLFEPVVQPRRERLPATRESITHHFTIVDAGGEFDGYITVGLYADGRPGEVFLESAKQGSTLNGLLDTVGILLSMSLQYGIPLDAICGKLAYAAFEPSGPTRERSIPFARSIVDYVARWLGMQFSPALAGRWSPPAPEAGPAPTPRDPGPEAANAHVRARNGSIGLAAVSVFERTGQVCSNCGSTQMVRVGTCMQCTNCYESVGGCGG